MSQLGMVIDMERCYGCRACMEACKVENSTPRGAFWMHVFRYEEGEYPEVDSHSMPRPCQHCSEPTCSYVCPTEARYKREEDGVVLTDYDTCIGCRFCEVGCPYGVNYMQFQDPGEAQYGHGGEVDNGLDVFGSGSVETEVEAGDGKPPWHDPVHDETFGPDERHVSGPQPEGVMGKCTFCVHRQDDENLAGTAACAQTCPVDAIKFGDMDDPESGPRKHLQKKQSSSTFRLLEERGTQPNVVYIGEEPSDDANQIQDAGSYFKDAEEAIDIERNPPEDYSTELEWAE